LNALDRMSYWIAISDLVQEMRGHSCTRSHVMS
jgi:hypothetical protein